MKSAAFDVDRFWEAVLKQDAEALRAYFYKDAFINWHCTNEHFTAEEYIRANCEYPGEWAGEIERLYSFDDMIVTVVHVYPVDGSASFHVTSFIGVQAGKICSMDEYWADDSPAPQWRLEKHLGKPIR